MEDFFFFLADDAEKAADWIIEIVTERIPQKFGFEPIHDIQVLAPIYRGPAGVIALNDCLQEKLNPAANNKLERTCLEASQNHNRNPKDESTIFPNFYW